MKKEYILCAAIHFNDEAWHVHQPPNIKSGYVVCGRRHSNCFCTLELIKSDGLDERRTIQGFLTSKNRFVNRKEAGKIAFEAKQIKKETTMLFSEDLY